MLVTKVKYAKLIIENPYPSFIQGTLKQSTAEVQCHSPIEFLHVIFFLKVLKLENDHNIANIFHWKTCN